jgi:DNA-binding HxlR family transcriptional regulator
MKRIDKKSDCAINFSLETFGDTWSLLIVRDIVFYGKKTYGEFLASDERIGTSVLARRLVTLEKEGILNKKLNKKDKRKEEYLLTKKGLDLIPILIDLTAWGAKYDSHTGASGKWVKAIHANRETVVKETKKIVKNGGYVIQDYSEIE